MRLHVPTSVPPPLSPAARAQRLILILALLGPLALLLLGVVVVQYFDLTWIGVLGLLVILAGYLLGMKFWFRFSLVGPLGYYELIRFARQGWTTWLRCLYAILLLIVLAEVYRGAQWGQSELVTPSSMGRIAERFVLTVLIFMNAVVLLLTPVYLCSAVIEERRRRTLDFLFTSHLTDSEIILGKLWARCGTISLLLLTGVPLFSLIQLWGGVDVHILSGGVAVTLITLVHAGALSLYASTIRNSVGGALVLTYIVLVLLMSCCSPFWLLSSPFGFLMELESALRGGGRWAWRNWLWGSPAAMTTGTELEVTLWLVLEYLAVHGVLTVIWLTLAIKNLRKPEPPASAFDTGLLDSRFPTAHTTPYSSRPPFFWIPISDDQPLLKKEVYANLYSNASLLVEFIGVVFSALVLAVAVGLGLDALLGTSANAQDRPDRWVGMVSIFNVLLLSVVCLAVLLRSSSAISREREGNTLETLLTLPTGWGALLWAKWLGSIWRFQLLLVSLLGLWLAALVAGSLHPLSFLLLIAQTVVHLGFCASFGLWLSVICPTTTRANLIAFSTALALVILPLWLFWEIPFFAAIFNPTVAWWTLPFTWRDLSPPIDMMNSFGQRLLGSMLNLGFYGMATLLFWVLAWERFRATALRR